MQCVKELASGGHSTKESESPLMLEEVGEAREYIERGVCLTERMSLLCSEVNPNE